MTTTTNAAAIRHLVKVSGFTVTKNDTVRGIYLEDGILATIDDLVTIHRNGGDAALVAVFADSTAIHG